MGSTLRRATVMWRARARGADLRERDFFTGAAGSVDGVHDLERLVAVLAGDQLLGPRPGASTIAPAPAAEHHNAGPQRPTATKHTQSLPGIWQRSPGRS